LNPRSHLRLMVLHVIVVSLLLVLTGRLWYLQVMNGDYYANIAADNRMRDIVVPAIRGQILDQVGRPLVRNRTALVVSVDRTALSRQPDSGKAVLGRLAKVLGITPEQLNQKIRLCGPKIPRPCWPGSPFQPIPVDDRVDARTALQIMERQEAFPGVSAQMQAVRHYPQPEGASAAQAVGYLQPVTQEELDQRKGLKVTGFSGVDLVGRDGLEAIYDADLRGRPGVRQVNVDSKGRVTGTAREIPAIPGAHVVTSIDARVQGIVEKSLKHAIDSARQQRMRGEAAAGVVLDVKTGRVVALAGWPTYDPSIWIGGVSENEYTKLLSKDQGEPLVPRATQGQFAPGSTFKISSTAAAVKDGYSLDGTYNCPGSFQVGQRASIARSSSPATPSTTGSPTSSGCATARPNRGRAPRTRWSRWPGRSGSGRRPASTCRTRRRAGSRTGTGRPTTGATPRRCTASTPRSAIPMSPSPTRTAAPSSRPSRTRTAGPGSCGGLVTRPTSPSDRATSS
jgi:penicillin-binding protein 2